MENRGSILGGVEFIFLLRYFFPNVSTQPPVKLKEGYVTRGLRRSGSVPPLFYTPFLVLHFIKRNAPTPLPM